MFRVFIRYLGVYSLHPCLAIKPHRTQIVSIEIMTTLNILIILKSYRAWCLFPSRIPKYEFHSVFVDIYFNVHVFLIASNFIHENAFLIVTLYMFSCNIIFGYKVLLWMNMLNQVRPNWTHYSYTHAQSENKQNTLFWSHITQPTSLLLIILFTSLWVLI